MIDIQILEKAVNGATPDGKHTSWVAVKRDYEQMTTETHTPDYYRIYWSRHAPVTSSLPLIKRLSRPLIISGEDVEGALALKRQGYNVEIWTEDGRLWAQNKPFLPKGGEFEFASITQGDTITIAIVSDTHIGSKFHDARALRAFYAYAYSRGVRDFYHAGDVTDGYYKNRDDSFWEQNAHGFQEQLTAVVTNYPKIEGVTTYFITGNHDVTHLRNGGANMGESISMVRPDMVYLGHNYAKVWLTPEVDISLVHPTDGGAMAISHRLQRIIDEGRRNSKILVVGHYHKGCYLPKYKGVHGFVAPCFQRQTGFMRDNGLDAFVGGIILTFKVVEGEIISMVPEFVDMGMLERSED